MNKVFMSAVLATVSAAAFAAEPNLFLNAKASASSLEKKEYAASCAVDGKISTRWASAGVDKATLTLDLGKAKTFQRITIAWEVAGAKEYTIDVSQDGKVWTTIETVKDGKKGEKREFKLKKAQTARFVRVNCTKRATQFGNSIYEIQGFAK